MMNKLNRTEARSPAQSPRLEKATPSLLTVVYLTYNAAELLSANEWKSFSNRDAIRECGELHAEIETLRAGYDAARLEIASLQARVQELGQMARDVNSRRVLELEAQLAAIGAGGVEPLRKRCLHQISDPGQAKFSPLNDAERLKSVARGMSYNDHGEAVWKHTLLEIAMRLEAGGYTALQPAAQAAPEDGSARFKAQHEFLIWNREQTPPPIESATEYSVFNQAVDFYLAARAAQGGA